MDASELFIFLVESNNASLVVSGAILIEQPTALMGLKWLGYRFL